MIGTILLSLALTGQAPPAKPAVAPPPVAKPTVVAPRSLPRGERTWSLLGGVQQRVPGSRGAKIGGWIGGFAGGTLGFAGGGPVGGWLLGAVASSPRSGSNGVANLGG